MTAWHSLTVFLALALLGAAQPQRPIDSTDPAKNLAPVRLFVSTRAGAVDVIVANASVASYRSSIVSGHEGVRSSQTGQTLRISGNIAGEQAEAQFDLILADVPASGTIGWQVSAARSAETVLDVQVPRGPGRPQSIDRFTTDQATATFATDAALLQPGSVRVAHPPSRLVLAGFSQGGAIALHTGLRYADRLAGIMALSTYVPLASTLTAEASLANRDVPIFMAHGRDDSLIPVERAVTSREALRTAGYKIEWHEYAMDHAVCREEIDAVAGWLRRILA